MRIDSTRPPVPRRYWTWLVAAACASLGTQAAIFGLSWSAAGRGAALAGALLTVVAVPRIGLTLVGGAVADRHGPVMVVTASGVAVILLAVAGVLLGLTLDEPIWLLFALALGLGTVSAFQVPASGAMPACSCRSGHCPGRWPPGRSCSRPPPSYRRHSPGWRWRCWVCPDR